MSDSAKGKIVSEETRKRMSISGKGKDHTKAMLAAKEALKDPVKAAVRSFKISLANKNKPNTKVELECQQCHKIFEAYPSEIKKGRKYDTPECFAASRVGKKVPPFTEEHCRRISESHKGLHAGDKNPNWKGGLSIIPYTWDFNGDKKKMARRNFDYTCQECHVTEEELRGEKSHNRKLRIHHIDYNKKNSEMLNLIPLCVWCHGKVNSPSKLQHFFEKYAAIIRKRYGVDEIERVRTPILSNPNQPNKPLLFSNIV